MHVHRIVFLVSGVIVVFCPHLLYISDGVLGLVPVPAGEEHFGPAAGQAQSRGFTDARVPAFRNTTWQQ